MSVKTNLSIRPEAPDDYPAIEQLTFQAFLTLDFPGRLRINEHYLIHLLQNSASVIPGLCFVAERNGEIIGHILYTKGKCKRPDGSEAAVITFGPLSVLPRVHKQGVGKALVLHSLKAAQDMGFGAVFIIGVPDYYPKLGFHRASDYSLTLSDGSAPDAFMAYELKKGFLDGGGTYCDWAPEFDKTEKDNAEFDAYHQAFIAKYYADTLILRPFFENDMALMRRWLYAEHVKPWYEQPEDWLKELQERHETFSFVTHMIAEINGIPIGFCQYYDCFHSMELEIWDMDFPAAGEVFSIDYLIGEPVSLRQGYAKAIVSQLLEKLRTQGAKTVIVLPDQENTASNRTLQACGFQWDGQRYVLHLRTV